tara:strand:- start:1512 stop:1850 length:339 start_codon:yes stop_codon:yes gene_type:complete
MGNRYNNKTVFRNQSEAYENILEERQVPYIRQYGTPQMASPTPAQRGDLVRIQHIWKVGDRFYKLALKYYNDAQYWWVIALYNKKPTEAHVKNGDVLLIPLPLEDVLRVISG